jgi:hypothetical protein
VNYYSNDTKNLHVTRTVSRKAQNILLLVSIDGKRCPRASIQNGGYPLVTYELWEPCGFARIPLEAQAGLKVAHHHDGMMNGSRARQAG